MVIAQVDSIPTEHAGSVSLMRRDFWAAICLIGPVSSAKCSSIPIIFLR